GVGAATAQLLAQRGAGVVINYRQKAPRANKVVKQIEEAGGRAVAVGADITTDEGRKSIIDGATNSFGSVNVLILNASGGMESDLGSDYAMRLNRDAQVSMLKAAAEVMEPGSQIVFVTSHQRSEEHTSELQSRFDLVCRLL